MIVINAELGNILPFTVLFSVAFSRSCLRRCSRSPVFLLRGRCCVGFRAVYLLVDAYHSEHVLPLYAVQLLDGLAFPFFIAALISVDRVLLTVMRPSRLHQGQRSRSAIEGLGVVVYTALSVVVYVRAALVPRSRSWIVGTQAVFVTWSLTLFFLVVGRCWDLRRTGRRAVAVRSLLNTYVRLKRHVASASENSASSGYGSTSAARRHLRLLRRQMEVLSYDGGFPMTSRRQNEATASTLTSSSSSSSSTDLALSTDSFRPILSRHDVRERSPSAVPVSDCAAVDGVDLEDTAASCAILRADRSASGSDHEVLNVHPVQDPDVGMHHSPTRCSQQTWIFFDNRSSAAPADQLLVEIASGSGRRMDATSGFRRQLGRLWRGFGNGRRRLYEYLRAEAAEWLGLSGQLRLMTQNPPRHSSKSRLARSRSRASNISAGQRSSSYKLAQPVSDIREPDVADHNSQMVTSLSQLSESTYTELSLFSVPVLTGSSPTDDGHEVSREETDLHETGYTADTEPETTCCHDGQRIRWSRDRVKHNTPSSDHSDFTSGRRIELSASTTRRLRMRRHIPDVTLLQRSTWAAVTVASATLSVCALQIYGALGIYGVLSNERIVKSLWAWLAFQSVNR